MKLENLPIGTRVYNQGDMANVPHFGTITGHRPSERWLDHVEITPDADEGRDEPYYVPAAMFSAEFKGHSGTRLVTAAAYRAWRESQARQLQTR